MASTDLERGLVGFLVWTLTWCNFTWSCTASSILPIDSRQVVLMWMFVNWQADGKVQTLERRLVEFLVWAMVWCNLMSPYMASSISPADSSQLFFMCIFVDWQVDGKYRLGKKIGWVPCIDPGVVQFDIVLSNLIHFACQFKTSVLNVYVCGLASWWQVQTQTEDWLGSLSGP